MSNQHLSINAVKEQFTNWRKNKLTHNEKIPTKLWAQVKILLKSNRYSKIARQLSLTTEQFRNNKLISIGKTTKTAVNSFVTMSIPPSTIKPNDQPQGSGLTIIRGETKCIIANPTIEQLQLIIFKILG